MWSVLQGNGFLAVVEKTAGSAVVEKTAGMSNNF